MNYEHLYYAIVLKRKFNPLKKLPTTDPEYQYCEQHHIQMRSMGGNNDKANLVNLTAREHYLAHLILWKWLQTDNAFYAVKYIADRAVKTGKARISSREYAKLREIAAIKQAARAKKQKHKPFIMITNGKVTKQVPPDTPIPIGWRRGMHNPGERRKAG